jgi:hypothetical protein
VFIVFELIPLLFFVQSAVSVLRGRPRRLTRRSVALLALAYILATALLEFMLILGDGLHALGGMGWCKGCVTSSTFDSGFWLTLGAYALALIASLLLPVHPNL